MVTGDERGIGVGCHGERLLFLANFLFHRRDDNPHNVIQVHALAFDFDASRFHARNVEQVVHQRDKAFRIVKHDAEIVPHLVIDFARIAVEHHLGKTFNRSQRRAQFMRHERHEFRFHAVHLTFVRHIAQDHERA